MSTRARPHPYPHAHAFAHAHTYAHTHVHVHTHIHTPTPTPTSIPTRATPTPTLSCHLALHQPVRREWNTDTLHEVQSMTKTVTAAAFMILVEEGKASLDDPVSK